MVSDINKLGLDVPLSAAVLLKLSTQENGV